MNKIQQFSTEYSNSIFIAIVLLLIIYLFFMIIKQFKKGDTDNPL
jgi:hypothetical protein